MKTKHKEWKPGAILITLNEVDESIRMASASNRPFAPSPISAGLIVFVAIHKMLKK